MKPPLKSVSDDLHTFHSEAVDLYFFPKDEEFPKPARDWCESDDLDPLQVPVGTLLEIVEIGPHDVYTGRKDLIGQVVSVGAQSARGKDKDGWWCAFVKVSTHRSLDGGADDVPHSELCLNQFRFNVIGSRRRLRLDNGKKESPF